MNIRLRKRTADDGPCGYVPGVYDVDYRVPGSGGLVPFGVVNRTDNARGVTICWQWAVTDPEGIIPDALAHLRVAGGAVAHKRDAVAQLTDVARQLTDHLRPPEDDYDDLDYGEAFSFDGRITAGDVIAQLDRATELAEVWLLDHSDDPLEDRVALYATLTDLTGPKGRLGEVAAHLRDELHPALRRQDAPVVEVDGRLWRAGHRKTRKGYDKDSLRRAITRTAMAQRPVVDEATGEVLDTRQPAVGEVVDTIWLGADVATGRTKVLREEFGIDVDEYAESSWTPILVEVAEADLPPDERAMLRGEEVPE